jgi:hypothetical protein
MTAWAPVEQAEMGARLWPRRLSAVAHDVVLLHHRVEAADRRAEEDAGARRVVHGVARVGGRLLGGGERQQDVAIHAPRLLGAGHGDRIEALDLARDPDRHVARVELRDLGDARAARQEGLPGVVGGESHRRDAADARDRDALHARGDRTRCRVRARRIRRAGVPLTFGT